MDTVGLFYVGAVLIINGLLLLGRINPREAAPLNLFVGALQVVVPTALLIQAESPEDVFAAFGLYLFGFTYLWVGLNSLLDWPGRGLGWFSAFVSLTAFTMGIYQAAVLGDGPFAVIWLCWSVLWGLFFLVLGLGADQLAAATGWIAILQGLITAAVPAFLILTDQWRSDALTTVGLATVAVLGMSAALLISGRRTAVRSDADDAAVVGD